MILRIVRMEFQSDQMATFLDIFNESKDKIRAFPGCRYLKLMEDPDNPQVRYTYSLWESQDNLNAYRKSKLFGLVWPRTKTLFAQKPMAWSLLIDDSTPILLPHMPV